MFTSGGRKTQTDVCTTECPLNFISLYVFIQEVNREWMLLDIFDRISGFKKRAAHSGILKYGNVCKPVRKKMF